MKSLAMLPLIAFLTACATTPDPAPASKPARAEADRPVHVSLRTNPADAEVWIGGDFVGTTQLNYGLEPGTHTIEFRREGYRTWKRDLVVREGIHTVVSANLQKE